MRYNPKARLDKSQVEFRPKLSRFEKMESNKIVQRDGYMNSRKAAMKRRFGR